MAFALKVLGYALHIAIISQIFGSLILNKRIELKHKLLIHLSGILLLVITLQLIEAILTIKTTFSLQELNADIVASIIREIPSVQALLIQLLIIFVAYFFFFFRHKWIPLMLFLTSPLMPGLLVHSDHSAGNHNSADMLGTILHVSAVFIWVSSLVFISRKKNVTDTTLQLYSPIALFCVVALAISGTLKSFEKINTPSELFTSSYGRILVVKIFLFTFLIALGYYAKQYFVKQNHTHLPKKFLTIDVLLLGIVTALGVLLTTSVYPKIYDTLPAPVPERLSASLFVTPNIDWTFFFATSLFLFLYLRAVRVLKKRGDQWSLLKTFSVVIGYVLLYMMTSTKFAIENGHETFSGHMTQHMSVAMFIPIFFVLGSPITLFIRALHTSKPGQRLIRDYMVEFTKSKIVFLNPLFITFLFSVGTVAFYYTPLFNMMLESMLVHMLSLVHFFLTGYLFYFMILGADPLSTRPIYFYRILLLFISVPIHVFFGLALMMSDGILGEAYYSTLNIPWINLANDQNIGGGIVWVTGEVPLLFALCVIIFQWTRSESRLAKRMDKINDERPEIMKEYNTYLQTGKRDQH